MEARFHSGLLQIAQARARLEESRKPIGVASGKGLYTEQNPPAAERTGPPAASTRDPWPSGPSLALEKEPRILILKQDEDAREWIYRSEHFDFISNAPLRQHVLREFAALFELTHLYCHRLPFSLSRTEESEKFQVHLIENYTHYIARGGMQNSGGVYLSDVDLVLVPFDGLGLKARNGSYSLDNLRTNQTLMHEATHMLMRGPLLMNGWFVEGSAEYVATIPIAQNTLLLSNHLSAVKNYVTSVGYKGRGGHGLGNEITLAPLKSFMEGDYENFQATPNAYPYALLLFHYFAHSDGAGDGARLRKYVEALYAGAGNNSARKHLLAGRSYKTLEKLLTDSWKDCDINLTFRN